jgi:hypothetical protein
MEQIVDLRYDTDLFICDDHRVGTDTSDDHVPAKSTLMIPFAQRVSGAGGPRRERR